MSRSPIERRQVRDLLSNEVGEVMAEIVLDTGGWISGPALNAKHRQLARDVRTDRVGVVMATPDELGTQRQFWLRPVGGGIEWTVPRECVQFLTGEGIGG